MIVTYNFITELEQQTKLHMVRIRFGTFSFYKITKGVKTNLVDKIAHLGGTLGLFNGFTAIALFEFIPFGITFIIQQYNAWKNKGKQAVCSKVEVFRSNEKKETSNDTEKQLHDIAQKFEVIRNHIDTLKTALGEKMDVEDAEEKINKNIDIKKNQESQKK